MKIRKILALLVALSMAVAVMPGFGTTAFAAIKKGQGIVTSDGSAAYATVTDDLVTDGAFETDQWDKALTTGAYVDSSGGNPGVRNAIPMNTDPMMIEKGAVAFERVEGRTGMAISPAFDAFTPDASVPRYTNDANGPTSIKHYIQNPNSGVTRYYVSFWAKAIDGMASFRYFIGGVKVGDKIPSSSGMALNDEEWTHIDAVVQVESGQYLLLNIFDMPAKAIAIDDVEICEVTRTRESNEFVEAIAQWKTLFPYYNNQLIDENMTLPRTSGRATVTWTSTDSSVIDPETGVIGVVSENTRVGMTATLTIGSLSFVYEYSFVVDSFSNRIQAIIESENFIDKYVDPALDKVYLPDTIEGFDGSVVTWTSSNESIIAPDGTYNPPEEVTKVILTPVVSFMGEENTTNIEVYVGTPLTYSLIPNGSFEAIDGNTIPGWTVGTLDPMTVNDFDYEIDPETGNRYILSIGHETWNGRSSIRKYVDLEPGKTYSLSYKIWYNGERTCQECYTGAFLVSSQSSDPNAVSNTADTSRFGGLYYPGSSYSGRLSKENGWQTIVVPLLKPTEEYHTLLISAEWLNKAENGYTDGRWAFDDFILREYTGKSKADVTINYLDEEGESIKKAKTVRNVDCGLDYYVNVSEKADIKVGTGRDRVQYRYIPTSVDYVNVSDDSSQNVINLYFKRLIQSDVTVRIVDESTGEELRRSTVDTVNGYVDYEYVPEIPQYNMTMNGVHYGLDETRENSIVVTGDPDADVVTLYYKPIDDNLITNGDFNDGYNGWTTRQGNALSGGTIALDSTFGTNVLTISTGGRDSATAIGTQWSGLQVGAEYVFSFDVGGEKPGSGNYQYNKISDAYRDNGGIREVSGNELLQFGEVMTANVWNHMELRFIAKSSNIYFQSSWVNNMKFANFIIRPVGTVSYGNIRVNFVDKAGRQIKEPVLVENLIADTTYTAPASMTSDFESGGYSYRLLETSDTSTRVRANRTVDLMLKFEQYTSAGVNLNFVEKETGTVLTEPVDATGEVGTKYVIPDLFRDVIVYEDAMYAYDSCDPEEFVVTSDPSKNNITLYFVPIDNMITNGDFEAEVEGSNIPEWTAGNGDGISGVAQMTTAKFTVETEEDGNRYLKSKGGQGMADSGSIKRFYTGLTPGRKYYFSFRVKRTKALDKSESWLQMELVKADGKDIGENNTGHDQIVEYREKYGSLIPELNNGSPLDMQLIGPDDGWKTVETVFTPDNEFNVLLIGAKWLDDGWCFDDFKMTVKENVKFGSVVLHYVDANGETIKRDTVIDQAPVGAYKIPDSYTEDITSDGILYRFNSSKTDLNTTVEVGGRSEVTLYYDRVPTTLTVNGTKVTLSANDNVKASIIVAQYDENGAFIKANTTPVDVTPGTTRDVEYDCDENAATIKAMLIDLESMGPVLPAVVADAPKNVMTSARGQDASAFHEIESQTGKVRYSFEVLDLGSVDSGIMLGNSSVLNTNSKNYFADGSIVLLFANGTFSTRDADAKKDVAKYNVNEKFSVVVETDIPGNTYSVSVNGTVVAQGVGYRTATTEINTLALSENKGGAAFEVYDFKVEKLD